jgi:hypothetical protein
LNDCVIDFVFFGIEVGVTVATAAYAVLYANAFLQHDAPLFVLAAAGVGYVSAAIMLTILSAAVSAVYVCFVDSPDALQVVLAQGPVINTINVELGAPP